MSYVVQINDSAGVSRPDPIILRLSPGEERDIDLRIVNLGDPTNVTVAVSEGLLDSITVDKANHYVVLEETVRLKASMPELEDQVEGTVVVRSDDGTARVPVTMVCDMLYAPGGDDGDDVNEEDGDEDVDGDDWGEDASEPLFRDRPRRIRRAKRADDGGQGTVHEAGGVNRQRIVARTKERVNERTNERVGERANERANESLKGPATPAGIGAVDQVEDKRRTGPDYYDYDHDPEKYDIFQDDGILFYFKGKEKLRQTLVPAALSLALVGVLILTFYTETLPEFPGSLVASMLIVTLIIYGTATLLKA